MATVMRALRSQSIGTTPVIIGGYTAGSHSSGTMITGLTIANVLLGPSLVVTVQIKNGATVTNWVANALVMEGGCLTIADEGTRHAMAVGDQVTVAANLPSGVDVIMTVAEIDS